MKPTFERHSIATLSQRLKGLVSRNTVENWLATGLIRFEVGPGPEPKDPRTRRGGKFWLFKTSYLDGLEADLERKHEERVRRQLGNSAGAKTIRETARREALGIIKANVNQFGGRKVFVTERDPALHDGDAIGRTYLTDKRPRQRIQGGWGL